MEDFLTVILLQVVVQEVILLVLKLKRHKETGSLNEIILLVLCCLLDYLLVIFKLVVLENVPSEIIIIRIIHVGVLFSLRVVQD